jgi:hypothetical protein
MITRYKELELDDAHAGMVLACDLTDGRGAVLLQQGTTLTDTQLAGLERRGIERLRVLDDAVDEAQLAAERARVELRLARLFRHGAGGRADALLRAGLHDYRLEGLR